jgi:DNA-binding Lrp family transcriptional regulator
MINKKIILAFRPIIDFKKLGFHRYTILASFISDHERIFVDFCRSNKRIWDVGKFTGNYNYAIEVYAKNNEDFNETVEEFRKKFAGSIIDYETLVVTKELKHKYFFID